MTFSPKDLERAQRHLIRCRYKPGEVAAWKGETAQLIADVRREGYAEARLEAANLADGCIGMNNLDIADRIRALRGGK